MRNCRRQLILEVGCGNGALWTENRDKLPASLAITLSDVSSGMLRDARRSIGAADSRFSFRSFDCHEIPYPDESFDLVIANHVLFYCQEPGRVFSEVRRVLKKGGRFLCSTYGRRHMCEISTLVQEFDSRIVLSAEKLYEAVWAGKRCRPARPVFSRRHLPVLRDSIELDRAEPLIEYILSCHGNQNQLRWTRYHEFRTFVERKVCERFSHSKRCRALLAR